MAWRKIRDRRCVRVCISPSPVRDIQYQLQRPPEGERKRVDSFEVGDMEKNDKSSSADEKPQLKYSGIKAMPFVIGNETFEKLGTIGTSSNLLVYLTSVFHMKSITAATLINTFNGTTNFSPLLGAFLCDTYFGRYKTLGFASIASFTGMLVLTLTAVIPKLHPPHCGIGTECVGPTPWQMALLLAAFAFLIIGAGGIRPCNLAFGADQFNPNTESGKRGISSFFNWYYFTFTFAMMVSLTLIVYVQSNVSWALGLAIPTSLMFLSCVFFFVGTKIYVKVRPEGSPLTGVARVIMAAIKKRHLKQPEEPRVSLYNHVPTNSINSRLAHTTQFRCLDKAAIRTPADELNSDGSPANPLALCSLQSVEEVKCLIRVLPIWLAGVVYYVAIVQQQTYVVFQALQSDRRLPGGGGGAFRIPAASYIAFSMLALTIWIPIYDRLIVPLLRRLTGKDAGITLLQKIGIGITLSVAAPLVAGAVERRRRGFALTRPLIGVGERGGGISSLSALWLVPQLAISGLAEAFASVGMTEFYYKQFPENMRSIGSAFFLAGIATSNYVNGLLVTVVHRATPAGENWVAEDLNRGRLDRFYFMVGALEFLNLGFFLACARWYRYKGSGGGGEDCSDGGQVAMEKLQYEKGVV